MFFDFFLPGPSQRTHLRRQALNVSKPKRPWVFQLACCFTALLASASSILVLSTDELVTASDAVFRGRVVSVVSFKAADDLIYTRASLRVNETFKGTFPRIVEVVHRGGRVAQEQEFYGLSPRLDVGGEYLMFVVRGADGKLQCTQGHASAIRLQADGDNYVSPGKDWLGEVRSLCSAGVIPGGDVTDQAGASGPYAAALTGMLSGVNSRFTQPDRGEPIPYLIDADSLPSGMTLTEATNAVQEALNAWVSVTSLRFQLEAIQSFGQGADTIGSNDGKLRIQLHDNHGRISGGSVLGIGGRGASSSTLPWGWDIGGNVGGTEFIKSTRGYVVLKASHGSMQDVATFAEVLCHEIGHALNLAHSSEVVTGDPILSEAIMYFQAHADGRGATLGAYDPPIIRQIYPTNTPPFTFNRTLDVVTASTQPNIAGINEVELRGYDLQSSSLTVVTNGGSAYNGEFKVAGGKARFTADDWYSDSARLNPANGSYYDILYFRLSDGTNASPYGMVRVLSFLDDDVSPTDGIPSSWMVNYFGHANPQSGDKSRATDDADNDRLNNRQEFLLGTNPRDANSALRITAFDLNALQFQAKAYDLYEVVGSTNFTTWTRVGVPFVPTNADGAFLTSLPQTNIVGVVSNLPLTESQMFFRVLRVP
ncbi:MAG: hypothetical protein H7Y43_16670 [Akkermansiaceae bacterium]|nr:hypothetical protein [Verrucomicrobiales bacterium]